MRPSSCPFSRFSQENLPDTLRRMLTEAQWRRRRSPNLKRRRKGGRWYFSYRHPVTGREKGIGVEFEAAHRAAMILDGKLSTDPVQKLVTKVERPRLTLHQAVDGWFAVWKQDTRPSDDHARVMAWRLGKIKRGLPDKGVAVYELAELADFMDTLTVGNQPRYRDLLIHCFAFAVAKGACSSNIAEHLLKRAKPERQRPRLSAEQYETIRNAASPHLRLAMELLRLSLQRPADLCRIPADKWDGRVWRVKQGKTGKKLAIQPHPALRKAIAAAVAYRVDDCPALLCYKPKRRVKRKTKHWAQATEEMLTREFTDLMRKKYPKLNPRPTLYECKSLGAAQYEALGWPKERIQALAGHSDVSTTAIYTEGHEHYVPVNLSR